jgi:hypothetical protein
VAYRMEDVEALEAVQVCARGTLVADRSLSTSPRQRLASRAEARISSHGGARNHRELRNIPHYARKRPNSIQLTGEILQREGREPTQRVEILR